MFGIISNAFFCLEVIASIPAKVTVKKTNYQGWRNSWMLALTGLMSGVVGLSFNNTATAQINAPSQSVTVLPKHKHSSPIPRMILRRVLGNASKRLGVPKRRLKYKVKPKTFSNPCVFQFGQICTREYNPIHGWVVKVSSKHKSTIYHVAKDGRYIANPQAK